MLVMAKGSGGGGRGGGGRGRMGVAGGIQEMSVEKAAAILRSGGNHAAVTGEGWDQEAKLSKSDVVRTEVAVARGDSYRLEFQGIEVRGGYVIESSYDPTYDDVVNFGSGTGLTMIADVRGLKPIRKDDGHGYVWYLYRLPAKGK